MTTRLESDYNFVAGTYIQNSTILNHYTITLEMIFETENSHEQSIALLRMAYFIHEFFENCFFINHNETDVIKKYIECGFNVCTLPNDAEDQLIAIAILKKLNSILEDKLIITNIMITSRTSSGLRIYHDIDDEVDIFEDDHAWWNNSKLTINNLVYDTVDNVVNIKFKNTLDWSDMNLVWEENQNEKSKIIKVTNKH